MRTKVLILLMLAIFVPIMVSAFSVPERPESFVSDYANILKPEEEVTLENKLVEFEKQTSNEIAVVIIESLEGNTIENVAQEIFTKWGIGKKDKNNGTLFLISFNDRETRIHTGYGVEEYLTDVGTAYIQDQTITPAFREENYFGGINSALDKMIEALGGQQIVPEGYSGEKSDGFKFNFNFVFVVLFAVQWLIAILARSKSWWAGGVFGGIIALIISLLFVTSLLSIIMVFVFLIGFGLLLDFKVSRAYQQHKGSGKTMPWFLGGGEFGKGRGGGFGGFGGGMSGGGGSSGRW